VTLPDLNSHPPAHAHFQIRPRSPSPTPKQPVPSSEATTPNTPFFEPKSSDRGAPANEVLPATFRIRYLQLTWPNHRTAGACASRNGIRAVVTISGVLGAIAMDQTRLCARVGGRWAGVRVTFACVCLVFATGIGARERRTCIACISLPGLAFIKELISKSSSSLSVFARCGGKQIFLPGVVGILWLRVKHYWYVEACCVPGRALFSMFVDDPVAASTPCLLGLCTIVYALAFAFAVPTA
jgi:hypothetical protein